MSLAILLVPAARLELIDAQDWYESKATGLGVRFRRQVDLHLARMAEHPMHFPKVHGDTRRARVREFPYSLFFRLQPLRLVVVACFHLSRDPLIWQNRA